MRRTAITYAVVWLALLALLALTVVLAQVDLGGANTAVALLIAAAKAALVLWFFMQLRVADVATRIAAGAGLLLLAALLALALVDYSARG